MLGNCDVVICFPIYGQSGAIQKPDCKCTVCKTYIFINSHLLSYKNLKKSKSLYRSFHTIALSKDTFLPKSAIFLQRNADISNIKTALVLKVLFSETKYVCTYVPNFKFLA